MGRLLTRYGGIQHPVIFVACEGGIGNALAMVARYRGKLCAFPVQARTNPSRIPHCPCSIGVTAEALASTSWRHPRRAESEDCALPDDGDVAQVIISIPL